jgi:ATP-dependent Clp protease adaptor protein ClpS
VPAGLGVARRAVAAWEGGQRFRLTKASVEVAVSAIPLEIERTESEQAPKQVPAPDVPWVTVVHNDPVNLMSYVTYVFQAYFGYSKPKAKKLMLDVHHKGRAIVSSGSREEMERDVQAMHGYGLWATLQQDR